jgi:chromate transporter
VDAVKGWAASLALSAHLAALSLISFGGIPVVLPQIHQLVVIVNQWTTDREFADFFALSQIMPGPNFIFMLSLIGWKVGGAAGAVAATLGIAGPSCVLTFIGFRLWHRFRDAPWRLAVSRGIVPLTIGLIVAGGWVLARAGGNGWRGLAVTAATAALMLRARVNPLWLLSAGGVMGGLGLL